MEEQTGTLEKIGVELARLLRPLKEALEQPEQFAHFMFELGWSVDAIPEPLRQLLPKLSLIVEAVDGLGDGEYPSADEMPELIANISDLIGQIQDLEHAPTSAFPPELIAQNFLVDFPVQVLGYLLATYLYHYHPIGYGLLSLLGLIEELELKSDTPPAKKFYYMAWSDIPTLFSEPAAVFERAYGWRTSEFNPLLVYKNLGFLMNSLGIPSYFKLLDAGFAGPLEESAAPSGDILRESLRVPLYRAAADGGGISAELGVGVYGVPESGSRKPGLTFLPYVLGSVESSIQLSEEIQLLLEGNVDVSVGLGIVVRPDESIRFIANLLPEAGADVEQPASANFALGLAYAREDLAPKVLIGRADGSRVEMKSISLKSMLAMATDRDDEFKLEIELQGGKIAIQGGESDGFLQTILGDGINADFDLAVGWSSLAGVYFRGSGGLEISLPTHIDLGPLEIQNLILSLIPRDDTFPVNVGASIKTDFGPLKAVVEDLGLRAVFSFPDAGGNLGLLDLQLGFKPPSGVGLSIDTGAVKGGGYLYFNPEKEEYDGVLELDLSGIVSVKAIGLISTRLPDGSKGFSLLLILTAEFGSPIQLGLGFTLSGVGGLLGLNRTMRLEAIAAAVRDGGINSIMFPQNVVENAPRIISDLKNYFPVEEGTFLIGPMVKIGWGTPNLVTVSLGVIIEIPGDSAAIVGVLKVVLPDEEAALIVIQVNFMGAIEFDKQRLWFFAVIFESRILFITLEGGMGFLVGWGADPSFVVSVGGFHPAFNPPPLPFGDIPRIEINILNTDFARIRVTGYFAVTSNSVQFGAAVELFFGVSAFNISGHLAFDALFRFSPFYFIISISASLSVTVFGIGLFSVYFSGSLEGPTPWLVAGTGSISLLFFEIDVDFSHTWGDEAETTLPPVAVMPLLEVEYEKLENWLSVIPPNNKLLVSLRKSEEGTSDLILHPLGSLKVSQRAVPLGLTIDKVGNQSPSDANHFDIRVSTTGLDEAGRVDESFAVGQYFAKSDNDLLSAKSFEPMKGGVELSVVGEPYRAAQAVKRVVRYEKIILDTNYKRFVTKAYNWMGSLFELFLNGNAVAQSVLSHKEQKARRPFAEKVRVGTTLYTVARTDDNTAFREDAMGFNSQAKAEEYRNQQIAADGNLAKMLHVIPEVEAQK